MIQNNTTILGSSCHMNSSTITIINVMASQVVQASVVSSSPSLSILASKRPSFLDRLSTSSVSLYEDQRLSPFLRTNRHYDCDYERKRRRRGIRSRRSNGGGWVVWVSNAEDTEVSATSSGSSTSTAEQETDEPDPEDLEYVSQIKRVLELLRKNRDMAFNEVKLTIVIEDPRDVERRRLLGIDDENAPTRDALADALEEVNKGKVPENRLALKMLAEEMISWPNLEEEAPKKKSPGKSVYAKATDTGVDPKEAAKRLNIDWDAAAEFEDEDDSDDADVPPAVGYGALYLVTAFPVIIGISVVLILFYNSLQ